MKFSHQREARCYGPGPGWKRLANAVFEHDSGARIHLSGLVRMPDKKTFFSLSRSPECRDGWKHQRVCGNNRKRGLMSWAVNMLGA